MPNPQDPAHHSKSAQIFQKESKLGFRVLGNGRGPGMSVCLMLGIRQARYVQKCGGWQGSSRPHEVERVVGKVRWDDGGEHGRDTTVKIK